MSLATEAMVTAGARARVRIAILKLVQDLSVIDRMAVLAEAIMEIEQVAAGMPTEEPVALPAPARRPPPPAAQAPKKSPAKKEPPLPFEPRPSPRPGAGGAPTRKSMAGRKMSKIVPGKTTSEAAQAVGTIVGQFPGIRAIGIAEKLNTTRVRLIKTIRLAKELGIVQTQGSKNGTQYYAAGAVMPSLHKTK